MPGGQGGFKKQVGKKLAAKRLRTAIPAATGDSAPRKSATKAAAAQADAKPSVSAAAMQIDAATTATIKSEISARGTRPTPANAGVLYLGHIPHGFYEEQMKGFFSQFGTVTRVRLARNKKTGRSKHYAFIEFKHADVAEVVAKAMNGYLLFSKVLVAKVMSPAEVHADTFKDANRKWRVVDRAAIVRKAHNRPRTEAEAAKREEKLIRSDADKRRKLAAAGIEYDFGGYAASAAKGQKRKRGVLTTEPPATIAASDTASSARTAEAPPAAEALAPLVGAAAAATDAVPTKKRKLVAKAETAEAVPEVAPAEVPTAESKAKRVSKKAAPAESASAAPPKAALYSKRELAEAPVAKPKGKAARASQAEPLSDAKPKKKRGRTASA